MTVCEHCGQEVPDLEQITQVKQLNGHYVRRDVIIENFLKYHNYKSLSELSVKSRVRPLPEKRMQLMTFLKMKTKMSYNQIGELLGGRDHSTVIHAVETIQDLMDTDPDILKEINDLNTILKTL